MFSKIDFVLVYQQVSEVSTVEGQLQEVADGKSRLEMVEEREYFLEELESVGIQMEEETLEVNSNST